MNNGWFGNEEFDERYNFILCLCANAAILLDDILQKSSKHILLQIHSLATYQFSVAITSTYYKIFDIKIFIYFIVLDYQSGIVAI